MSDTSREIASLALGLAAELERRKSRGQRWTQAPSLAPASAPQAPGPGKHSRTAQLAADCDDLLALGDQIAACQACTLCAERQRTAFAAISAADCQRVEVLFVADAPGPEEQASGLPLAGAAAELLDRIVEKGLRMQPEQVHVTQVLKCAPRPGRAPTQAERATCSGFLDREIELLQPKLILALGARAAEHLLKVERITAHARGRVHEVQGKRVIPTFHPAFLLENPDKKKDCWEDLKVALAEL